VASVIVAVVADVAAPAPALPASCCGTLPAGPSVLFAAPSPRESCASTSPCVSTAGVYRVSLACLCLPVCAHPLPSFPRPRPLRGPLRANLHCQSLCGQMKTPPPGPPALPPRQGRERATWDWATKLFTRVAGGESECLASPRTGWQAVRKWSLGRTSLLI